MALNNMYLSLSEKIRDAVKHSDDDVEFAFDSLIDFISRDIDGFTSYPSDTLAYAVQSRLEEIWSLLADEDRYRNAELVALFKSFIRRTERASGYEADIDFPDLDQMEDGLEAEIEAEDACEEE